MIIVANARSTDRIASTEARATDGRIAVAGTSCDQIRDRLHHICGVQRYIHSDVDATAGSSVADHDTTGRSIGAITSIRVIEAQIHLPVIGLVFFTWAVNLDFPGLLNIDLRRICHPNDCEHILRRGKHWLHADSTERAPVQTHCPSGLHVPNPLHVVAPSQKMLHWPSG